MGSFLWIMKGPSLPGSATTERLARLLSSDFVRCSGFDSNPETSSVVRIEVYAGFGYTRRKKNVMKTSPEVPLAKSIRKSPTSPGAITVETEEKKKAERPNAAKGNAVAVPRWCGQFKADAFIAAAKAEQPPTPVKNEYRQSNGTDPDPLSYAWCRGKYPRASNMAPKITASRTPLWSTKIPTGIPTEYMPKFPAVP